jgi:hypothetical protein
MPFSLKKGLLVINLEDTYDTINHVNLLNEIARELYKEYNSSSFDFNTSTFILVNNIIQQRCSISPVNIVIEFDNASGLDAFNKLVMSTLKVLRDKGVLNKFNRIGYRTFWGQDYQSLLEANDDLVQCFHIDKKLMNRFGDAGSFRYGFITNENDYTINYNFMSMINREVKINNGMQVSEEEKYCALGDFDIFIDKDCKYSSVFTYISNFSSYTIKKLSLFESMIGGV